MEKLQDVTACCLQITDGAGAERAASGTSPSLPTSSALVWQTDLQEIYMGFFST